MKVAALGGCGVMGMVAVRVAASFDFVEEIIVADRNGEAAQHLADQMGPKVSAMEVDVMDLPKLSALLGCVDVVVSTIGPYYKFGTLVLKAAIEAECNYIDICDDWEPTLEMLDLDSAAKSGGVTAIIGAGASPGIANMLAVKAIKSLDHAHTVYTGWGATSRNDGGAEDEAEDSAALEHWVHQFTGLIRAFENGQYVDVRPLAALSYTFAGVGRVTCRTVGHPEPLTLPKYFPEIKKSYNVMNMPFYVTSVLKSLRKRVDGGDMSVQQAAAFLYDIVTASKRNSLPKGELRRYMMTTLAERIIGKKYLPAIHATAMGDKNGRETTVSVQLNGEIEGGMAEATCIPTVVALAMMANGEVNRTGVMAPEGCLDPDVFFDRLQVACPTLGDGGKDVLKIAYA